MENPNQNHHRVAKFDLCATFWTESQEQLLMFWGEKAKFDAHMHEEASAYYSKWYRYLGVPSILLSGFTGSGTLAVIGTEKPAMWLQLGFGVLMLISAALSTMLNFLNYGSLAEKHRNSRNLYESARARIDAELTRPRAIRKDAYECVEEFTVTFAQLSNTCPETPTWMRFKYDLLIDAKREELITEYIHSSNQQPAHVTVPMELPQLHTNAKRTTLSTDDAVKETQELIGLNLNDGDVKSLDGDNPVRQLQDMFEQKLELRRIKTKTRDNRLREVAESYALERNVSHDSLGEGKHANFSSMGLHTFRRPITSDSNNNDNKV